MVNTIVAFLKNTLQSFAISKIMLYFAVFKSYCGTKPQT